MLQYDAQLLQLTTIYDVVSLFCLPAPRSQLLSIELW